MEWDHWMMAKPRSDGGQAQLPNAVAEHEQVGANWPTPTREEDMTLRCKSTDPLHKPGGGHAMSISRILDSPPWTTPQAMDTMETDGTPRPSREATGRTTEYLARQVHWHTPHGQCNEDHTGKIGGGGELDMQVRRVEEGEQWPTPRGHEDGRTPETFDVSRHERKPGGGPAGESLSGAVVRNGEKWATPQAHDTAQGDPGRVGRYGQGENNGASRNLTDEVMQDWPTPTTVDVQEGKAPRLKTDGQTRNPDEPGSYRTDLKDAVIQWQTPSSGNFRTRGGDRADELGLDNQVKNWSTPRAESRCGHNTSDGHASVEYQAKQWPTPQVGTPNSRRGSGQDPVKRKEQGHQVMLQDAVTAWPTPQTDDSHGGRSPEALDEGGRQIMLRDAVRSDGNWTTPTASDARSVGSVANQANGHQELLHHQVRKWGVSGAEDGGAENWPTPKTPTGGSESRDSRAERGSGGEDLEASARNWATPDTGCSPNGHGIRGGQADNGHMSGQSLEAQSRMWGTPRDADAPTPAPEREKRSLNPDWEEILQGWPVGWTDPESPCAGTWPGWPAGQGPFQHDYEPPRTLPRGQMKNRTGRVKAIGNGVVPQTAEAAFVRLFSELLK